MTELSAAAKRIAPEEFEVNLDHWTDPFGDFQSEEKVPYVRADKVLSRAEIAKEFQNATFKEWSKPRYSNDVDGLADAMDAISKQWKQKKDTKREAKKL